MNANTGAIDNCLNCGGLICPPNMVMGYAGPVCHCPKNPAHVYQRPASKEYTNQRLNQNMDQYLKGFNDGIKTTWAKAAEQVSICMMHYPEGKGDPKGCLEGLWVEFRANAMGDGPDYKEKGE